MKNLVKLAAPVFAGIVMLAGTAQAASIAGTWTTEKGWKIKLYQCGSSYCGKVVGGTTARDVHNPKKSLRSRKMVGVRMIWGMKKSGSGYKGSLYNPNDGKIYTGKITPVSANRLKLAGCAFAGLICKSQTWRK